MKWGADVADFTARGQPSVERECAIKKREEKQAVDCGGKKGRSPTK
jgi:hypothetical protein